MEVFTRGGEALAQALREGREPTRGLKAMLLPDSISIYCGHWTIESRDTRVPAT
jgi:hypothetical protein